MSDKRLRRLRNAAAAASALCVFMLHTVLTVILEPGGFWKFFLIFVFGFIYQGLEYQLTIPSKPDTAPFLRVSDMVLDALLFPGSVFVTLGLSDPVGLGKDFLATAGCILFIMIYRAAKAVIERAVTKN